MARQRYKKTSGVELTEAQRCKLELGHWFFPDDELEDEHKVRGLWEANRMQLLADWILEKPGTRPWGWWRFDSPAELRRRIGGIGTALTERLGGGSPHFFGMPSCYAGDYEDKNPPKFESERDYLARHGLLTRVEK